MTPMVGSYDPGLVVLSIVIAILAASAALDLAGRASAARGKEEAWWIGGGAVAMGLGIWSMHYTGMLAFELPVPMHYHVPTVGLSLLAAVLASGLALFVSSRSRLTAGRVVVGSLAMGSGIAAMHYIGMAAMRHAAAAQWHQGLVVASVLIAVAVSAVALTLAFRFSREAGDRWTWRKAVAAVIMGLAIPSMHYVGMAAATFVPAPEPSLVAAVPVTTIGAVAIGGTTLLVLASAIGTSLLARYGEERLRGSTELLRNRERQLAEAQSIAHVGSWELDLTSGQVTWSDEAYRLYGVAAGVPVGYELFLDCVHLEDRARVKQLIDRSLAEAYDIEYEFRIVRPDGAVRHLVGRNVVTKDAAGKPVRLAGTSLDITERKAAEDALRAALQEVKTLRGYLRVCANCRRVLGQDGNWEQLESYVRRHTEAEFSHGICPECAAKWAASSTLE